MKMFHKTIRRINEWDNLSRDIIVITYPKIDLNGTGRKINLPEVRFGMSWLRGNEQPYLSVTGGIWNGNHTDYTTCGCSIQEKIFNCFYPEDELLKEICLLGKEYHLKNLYSIPPKVYRRIIEIVNLSENCQVNNLTKSLEY